MDDALGGEDVVDVAHGLGDAGVELPEADALVEGAAGVAVGVAEVAFALHGAEGELAVLGEVAEEVGAGGFTFDEADLGEFAADGEVVLVGAEDAGPDGVDDAEGFHLDLGGDAAVAVAVEPAAGFLLEGFV